MNNSDLSDRYRGGRLAIKVMWSMVALAMIVLGAIWTFGTSGSTQSFGPIIAGLGVALAYVVLFQKRH